MRTITLKTVLTNRDSNERKPRSGNDFGQGFFSQKIKELE